MNRKLNIITTSVISLLLSAVAATFSGCGDSLEKQVIRMQGMHVNLDFSNAIARYDGIDTVYTSGSGTKLVVFVDSLSCSSCFLNKLHRYSEINDTLNSHGGDLIVILNPKPKRFEDVAAKFSTERYPFWCILDKDAEFLRNNPDLPNNKLLHSFTLDNDDNIILVGDPAISPEIKQLLEKLLSEYDSQ